MKIAHLVDLLRAAELGCSTIEDPAFKKNVVVALSAGLEELKRRSAARSSTGRRVRRKPRLASSYGRSCAWRIRACV